jgi:hypothetical protein
MRRLLILPVPAFGLFIFALGATLLPSAAGAQRSPDPCSEQGSATACFVAHQAEYAAIFGLPTAPSRLAASEQIYRAMFFGRSHNPIVAVEFRRAPGREPIVSLHLPRDDDAEEMEEVSAAVPLQEWDRLRDRSRYFDRQVTAAFPAEGEIDGEPALLVCADGGLDIVEVTQPGASFPGRALRQRAESTCDQGLAEDYANELAATAVRLIPACVGLEEPRGEPRLLQGCGRLGGDRMAAAEVYNRLERFRFGAAQPPFAHDGVLDWMGEQAGDGRASAAVWSSRTGDPADANFFPRSIHGEAADRVRVRGWLERWTDTEGDAPVLLNAPVEMIWGRAPDQEFAIQRAVVGPYVQVPARCHPGRLTGAGGC